MFKIGNIEISSASRPFIIAEMSGNHNQSLEMALSIIEAAAEAGADAVKLQTYTADTMTLDHPGDDFKITDKASLWYGRQLHELYEQAHTPWEWHEALFQKAKDCGILCFSTPFDLTAVDFLESLDVPVYKIASFENTDVHLLRRVAQTGKPLIVSTGMASLSDIELIHETLTGAGCSQYALLKCTSAYPAQPSDANLATIPHMAQLFGGIPVGLSDHTMGLGVPVAAVALGACIIEKHFCLSRADGGVDSEFSLEPHELRQLVEETEKAWAAVGSVQYARTDAEVNSKQFRRSLYFVKDMQAGEAITADSIRSIRPGYGLEPRFWDMIIGRRVTTDIKSGERVTL